MATCDPIQFKGITPEIFSSITKQLAAKGFALNGPNGTVNGPFGIVIEYNWEEATGLLNIQVVEKSFFVTCSQIREPAYECPFQIRLGYLFTRRWFNIHSELL